MSCGTCWTAPTVARESHPHLEGYTVLVKVCDTCGRERRIDSPPYRGKGYLGDGSDPDRGADRHLSGRAAGRPYPWEVQRRG